MRMGVANTNLLLALVSERDRAHLDCILPTLADEEFSPTRLNKSKLKQRDKKFKLKFNYDLMGNVVSASRLIER